MVRSQALTRRRQHSVTVIVGRARFGRQGLPIRRETDQYRMVALEIDVHRLDSTGTRTKTWRGMSCRRNHRRNGRPIDAAASRRRNAAASASKFQHSRWITSSSIGDPRRGGAREHAKRVGHGARSSGRRRPLSDSKRTPDSFDLTTGEARGRELELTSEPSAMQRRPGSTAQGSADTGESDRAA